GRVFRRLGGGGSERRGGTGKACVGRSAPQASHACGVCMASSLSSQTRREGMAAETGACWLGGNRFSEVSSSDSSGSDSSGDEKYNGADKSASRASRDTGPSPGNGRKRRATVRAPTTSAAAPYCAHPLIIPARRMR